ncbi:MAG: caspase family protein [Candidatus Obscuribacterales bacterium]
MALLLKAWAKVNGRIEPAKLPISRLELRQVKTLVMVSMALLVLNTAPGRCAEEPGPGAATSGEQSSDPNRPIRDKWAVIIGIDKFQDNRIPTLHYSTKDARDFADFLVEKGNFARDHVLLLLDEDATQRNIEMVLGDDWLPRRVLADDVVLIFASTHGSPKELDVAGENFLIAYDTDPDNLFSSGIELETLAQTIKRRTNCDRVVLFLDACNSGAAAGGKGLLRTQNFNLSSVAGQGMIIISSSSADQRSWESKRYENGVFTRKLIDSLQVKGITTNLSTAFENLKDEVEQEVKFDRRVDQIPVMLMHWKGDEVALLSRPAKPRHSQEYTLPKPKPERPPVSASSAQQPIASVPAGATPPKTDISSGKTATTSSSTSGAATQGKQPASAAPIFGIIPFGGPEKATVYPSDGTLWGVVQSPNELMDLPLTLTDALSKELADNSKTKDRFVTHVAMGNFMRNSFPQFASYKMFDCSKFTAADWKAVKDKLTDPPPFLVVGKIKEVTWRPTTWSNRYSLSATARVIDMSNLTEVASVSDIVSKAPWTGDTGGGKHYFESTVIPQMARSLAKKLLQQMNNRW